MRSSMITFVEGTAGNPATIYNFSQPDSILLTAAQCVIIMDKYESVYEKIISNYLKKICTEAGH